MKKLFFIFTICIMFFVSFALKVNAEELFKITDANFDTSNSMFVISANDTSVESPIVNDIKLVKLDGRVYFDIDSSVITIPKQDWIFQSGHIKEIKVSQFSNNPCTVRVVIFHDKEFNPANIKFLRIKNHIIVKFKDDGICNNSYYQNTYRDEHSSSSDFYEYLTVTTPVTPTSDNIVGQIQDAFNTSAEQMFAKKELRLNTKYYLNNISTKQNGILINGFGSVTVERPLILQNPSRIVYDLPNTLVDTRLRNREIKINESESVKIGQFSVNKARIVITTEDVTNYIPIYSSDNQSFLIANYAKLNNSTLYNSSSNVNGYKIQKEDDLTESLILKFEAPIVHGLDRYNDRLILYLYNVAKYSEEQFKETFGNTFFDNAKIDLMPKVGLKLTIPLEKDALVSSYLGSDARTLKVTIKQVKKKTEKPRIIQTPIVLNPDMTIASDKKDSTKQSIVIDAGHGGTDCGAIGGGVMEKNITLDVAKRVEALLKQKGYDVKMTREDDSYVSLQDRVDISENYAPDIFVSIHVNSSVKPEIIGLETHYYHQESLSLAQTVHASLASAIQSVNRGLFKSKFYVINHTTSPAILIEIGFISNADERNQLISEQRKQDTAKAIADGIQKYLQQHK